MLSDMMDCNSNTEKKIVLQSNAILEILLI